MIHRLSECAFLPALAQAGPKTPGNQQSPMFYFVWFGIMILIFYFILIRPQQRREKERKEMLSKIKTGDRVAFSGGIIGTIANVKDTMYSIRIADKVKIDVARSAVTQVLDKGEPPKEEPAQAGR